MEVVGIPDDAERIRICAAGTCQAGPVGNLRVLAEGVRTANQPGAVDVRLAFFDNRDQMIAEAATSTELRRFEPGGEGCGECWFSSLRYLVGDARWEERRP